MSHIKLYVFRPTLGHIYYYCSWTCNMWLHNKSIEMYALFVFLSAIKAVAKWATSNLTFQYHSRSTIMMLLGSPNAVLTRTLVPICLFRNLTPALKNTQNDETRPQSKSKSTLYGDFEIKNSSMSIEYMLCVSYRASEYRTKVELVMVS